MKEKESFQEVRKSYQPRLPTLLKDIKNIALIEQETPEVKEEIAPLFEHTKHQKILKFEKGKEMQRALCMGVVFSGGQAAGGHNVVLGIYEALKTLHKENTLIGFLDGPNGLIEQKHTLLDEKTIDRYRNQGGFDMIGSGRTKIETQEQLTKALNTVKALKLDGLVVIGGDDSNTNTAVLAEFFKKANQPTCVIGVPKTIDGDLKSEYIETSFGFDSACKTYSELIGNIARDCLSSKKYTHFIRLMGRSASHIALECALQIQPNITFISEEVQRKGYSIDDLVNQLVSWMEARAKDNKHYGIVLIPEGIIEFIDEFKKLIEELNELLVKQTKDVIQALSSNSQKVYHALPSDIQKQLLLDRDSHGNVRVSFIESEKVFIELCKQRLKDKPEIKFSPQAHFFGYEGRACFPSNFDCDYCYALGFMSTCLILHQKTGYICAIKHLKHEVHEWQPFAVPIVSMLHLEMRKGEEKPVIKKALVDLNDKPFLKYKEHQKEWMEQDCYLFPGPMQFFGDTLTHETPKSLDLST
ncbi:MAG: Pyrophosphate--fructose 6-phosphate 1-phosphotransferase [Chlamydiae bacterium]|nr:Pyrophosphate--fructose 6-phosphate 1-phosphotransferase [Chlamydiota bacterium]